MASAHPVSFGPLLRRYRLAAGLTQGQLAERAGLSVRGIGALEAGSRRAPRRDTLALLADALGLDAPERARLEDAARSGRGASPPPLRTAPIPAALAPAPPLVGRTRELIRLGRHLAGEGPPLLLLAGEPGIGKTRLLQEAATRAREAGWTVLEGGCTRRSGQETFAPLLAALARFVAARPPARLRADLEGCSWLVRLLPELAERAVVPAPTWTLPPEQERRLMFGAVGRFLANVAGPAGTLLALDDLQWVGPDAVDLLAEVLRTPAERPLRAAGAFRATEVGAEHPLAALLADLARQGLAGEPLALGPLAPEEARELLGMPDDEADEHVRDRRERVLQLAGGIPFFLVSYAQSAGQGGADAELPWTVQQSVLQRVAALPEGARHVLGLAAVAGREVLRAVLMGAAARALGEERRAALEAAEAACRAGLLVEEAGGDYRFAHDLVREAVLSDLGAARQAEWHLAWAEALEAALRTGRPDRAAEMAHHFVRADEPARALPYALVAGDAAEAMYAHAEAERHYAQAAELARTLDDAGREAAALEKLGDVQYALGRYAEGLETYERAAHLYRQAGDQERHAMSAAQVARCTARSGRSGERELAARRLRELLRTLGSAEERARWDAGEDPLGADAAPGLAGLPPREAAQVCVATAMCNHFLGRRPDAIDCADRGLACARAAGEARLEAEAQFWRALALSHGPRGGERPDEALAAHAEAASVAEATGDLGTLSMALSWSAFLQTQRGAVDEALRHHARAIEITERWGNRDEIAFTHGNLGETLVAAGRWVEARTHFERGQVLAAALPPSPQIAIVAVECAWLALLQDRPEAPDLVEEAFALVRQHDHPEIALLLVRALAEADLLAGRHEAARARLEPLLAPGLPAHYVDPLSLRTALPPVLAWAAARRGDAQQAGTMLDEAVAEARRVGYRLALADALSVRALLATWQEHPQAAAAALEESLELCRAIPYPYAEAKALYVSGQLHTARGEPERARGRFEEALTILGRLGERLYAEHVERALVALPTG